MSTANDSKQSSITGEAYDLLDCFVSGLDDLVYEIAEAEAKGNDRVVEGVVEINRDDVKAAAELVFNAIRSQAGPAIPEALEQMLAGMEDCFHAKCERSGSGGRRQ
ncbi:hypothetical protein ACFL2H_00410 [Planctomycetota bacterium]